MAITPESIASHLAAFLVGAATSAAGKYFGTKYTEERLRKEGGAAMADNFKDLHLRMPELLLEMANDVCGDEKSLTREIIMLPSPGVTFNGSKVRFTYYESQHADLANKLSMIEERGFITPIVLGNGDTPAYRMTEAFVRLLKGSEKARPLAKDSGKQSF
ncbi:MAG: hypothetical protein HYX59_01465 [Elusimicrobia bacterium]|nr:hypothetical protein [Elusimicrobiota bacterium]